MIDATNGDVVENILEYEDHTKAVNTNKIGMKPSIQKVLARYPDKAFYASDWRMHVLLAAVLWLTGCSTPQQRSQAVRAAERQQQIGPARITPAELQSEIMTFTDM